MGGGADSWLSVDPGLLGLEQRRVCVEWRLLGVTDWFLWRRKLRVRLRRRGLRGRVLARRKPILQPLGEECKFERDSQRLQQDGNQQLLIDRACEFQWSRWSIGKTNRGPRNLCARATHTADSGANLAQARSSIRAKPSCFREARERGGS